MKICRFILEKTQVYDPRGSVRLCGWASSFVGRLTENTMEEIWNGEKARKIFKQLSEGDYSICDHYACPYLAAEDKEVPLIEIDEIPKMPTHLWLGYEEVCNYKCTVCWHPTSPLFNNVNSQVKSMRETIEKNLAPILPYVKHISAQGCGELFASKNILKILANWRPVSPKEECSVGLESNGSLFNEKNWKQIENLGQYKLSVAITVMSFDEPAYQFLSGTRLTISNLENNLRFIKSLREKGIINRLQIATVIQERNFRMLPEFTRRCIEEFGADSVRLRPYIPTNSALPEVKWLNDVKNINHPYHKEYVEMLQDPIFKHPNVDNWGMLDENYKWDLPYKVALNNEVKLRQVENKILSQFILNESVLDGLVTYLINRNEPVNLYKANPMGLFIAKKLIKSDCKLNYIIDFELKGSFHGVPIVPPDSVPPPYGRVLLYLQNCRLTKKLCINFAIADSAGILSGCNHFLKINKFYDILPNQLL